jgi:nitrite reductase/ring-hydroxylating ferredoxin subunit
MQRSLRSLARWLHARYGRGRDRYVAACAADDIAIGEIRRLSGLPAVLCRSPSRVYAVALTCPHAGAPLSKGRLAGDWLECPRHGARFALDENADTVPGAGALALGAYDVRVSDGIIYVSCGPRHHVYGRWDWDDAAGGGDGAAPA